VIYTRKFNQVHAAQWRGDNRADVLALFGDKGFVDVSVTTGSLIVVCPGGPALLIHPSEWLVVDEHNHFRTYTDADFRKTFEV
jgi:hypothetical protein